jgi:hypothetical protein
MKMGFLTPGPRRVVRLLRFWEGFLEGVHYSIMYTKKFQVYEIIEMVIYMKEQRGD